MAQSDWGGLERLVSLRVNRDINNSVNGLLASKLGDIIKIADGVVDILQDGFQLNDVTAFYGVISPLYNLVLDVSAATEEEKEEFVVEAMWLIYQTVDQYPDGKHNNINVPVVFGSLEKTIEENIIKFAAKAAIKAIKNTSKSN